MEGECVGNVTDTDAIAGYQDADHVEPVGLLRPPVTVDPDASGAPQLALLPPVDGRDGASELGTPSSLDLHERHHAVLLDYEIDVAMPGAEAALHDAPPPASEPPLRYPLAQLAQCLPGR